MKTESSVVDKRKLTDAEIGKLFKKTEEIIRRVEEETIIYEDAIDLLQFVVIEKAKEHELYLGTVRNTHRIKEIEHKVDCNKAPFIPDGCTLKSHSETGVFDFGSLKIDLFTFKKKPGESRDECNLRKNLVTPLLLNANVLDHILEFPYLIPDEWREKSYIIFEGTVYCYHDSEHADVIRALHWERMKGKWIWVLVPYDIYSFSIAIKA